MAQRRIDKVFAENLGLTFGGCVRDQILTVFTRDIPQAAGVRWPLVPFVGTEEKRLFKLRWAALLQGVGIWAARDAFPEIRVDEKLTRKVLFAMKTYADQAMQRKLLGTFSEEALKGYNELRQRFERLALTGEPEKEAFARAFLSAVWDKPAESFEGDRVAQTATMVGLAFGLFVKVGNVTRNQDSSYERGSLTKPQKKD